MNTPWGRSDYQRTLAPGIVSYNTPSHGGVHVEAKLNQKIHEAWRHEDGWYEEDLDWAIVAYHFPDAFKPEDRPMVIQTLKDWKPRAYMTVTGTKLKTEESMYLKEWAWQDEHKNHLQAVSAVGDWHDNVPKGFVGVTACIGGRGTNGHYAAPLRYFLVPDAEYAIPFAFADDAKYQETDENYRVKEGVKA